MDAFVTGETLVGEAGKDFGKELEDVARIGKMVLRVARERAEGGYSLPYLDPEGFSRRDVDALQVVDDAPVTVEDVAGARTGAVALVVEAAAQVAGAVASRNPAMEDLGSLESVFTLIKIGHGFVTQIEAQDPQVVIRSARGAMARRQSVPPGEVKLSDSELKEWSDDNFRRAGTRVGKGVQALKAYLGV